MIQLLKKLLDKLEPPANDWVLSRFGGYEGPETAAESQSALGEDDPPISGFVAAGGALDSAADEQETLMAPHADRGNVAKRLA